MELFPAIDLRGGRVVRLLQGDDRQRTVYADRPVEVLAEIAAAGVRWVHVVDLDAALGESRQRPVIAELAARARSAGGPSIQLGGGLRDAATVAEALATGPQRAVVGSLVATDPDRFAELAGEHPDRLVPALDVAGDAVRIRGWQEEAGLPLAELCDRLAGLPCPAVLVTDIDRDGAMTGPNLELARRVAGACGLPALLSGGVHSLADLAEARRHPEIAGAIVGRALYEGAFTLAQALAACAGEEPAAAGPAGPSGGVR